MVYKRHLSAVSGLPANYPPFVASVASCLLAYSAFSYKPSTFVFVCELRKPATSATLLMVNDLTRYISKAVNNQQFRKVRP
jgi:hypothetical protein